ncbi:hypothetical protein CR513_39368, partial [Mucuna pruriens]
MDTLDDSSKGNMRGRLKEETALDYEGTVPHQDDPMLLSIVYKVERVLIDQESLANVLYWTTFQKLGLLELDLEECP